MEIPSRIPALCRDFSGIMHSVTGGLFMASFRLESGTAAVVVDEHASEIHSFRRKDTDFEYMWQGDPAYWKGRNPTLFPMVGSTWDKILHINGKEYVTGNHGFTRNADFTCIEHDDSHLVMELKSSDETREQYPFDFTLHITYALEGETLKISYEITNENEVVMPFNFGLHPAFNCPLDPEKTFADYRIEFSDPESFHWLNTTLENEAVLDIQDREALAATIIIENPRAPLLH